MRRLALSLVVLCAAGIVPAVGAAQQISCVRGGLQRAVNLYIDAQTKGDTSGLPLGIIVHAADIQDADSAWDLLKKIKGLYCWLKVVFADSIYNRLPVLLACFLLGLTLIIVRRIAGTTGFVVLPRRWIVERTLGWLGRWRRLSKDYEELPEVSEAMVTLAAIRMMLQRLAHSNRKRLPPP